MKVVPLQGINMDEFLTVWKEFDRVGAPDPIRSAAASIMRMPADHLHMGPKARKQLEDLVAFYKYWARPGHVLRAMQAWNARLDAEAKKHDDHMLNILLNHQVGGMQ